MCLPVLQEVSHKASFPLNYPLITTTMARKVPKSRATHRKGSTASESKPTATASVVQNSPTQDINKSVSGTGDHQLPQNQTLTNVSQNMITPNSGTAASEGTPVQHGATIRNTRKHYSQSDEMDCGDEPNLNAHALLLANINQNIRARGLGELYQRARACPAMIPHIPPFYLYFSGIEYLRIFLVNGGRYADPDWCPAASSRGRTVTVMPPRIKTKQSAEALQTIEFRAPNGTPGPYVKDLVQIYTMGIPRTASRYAQVENGTDIVLNTDEETHFTDLEVSRVIVIRYSLGKELIDGYTQF